MTTLEAEPRPLQFICDVADAVEDGEEFDHTQSVPDEYGPLSRL